MESYYLIFVLYVDMCIIVLICSSVTLTCVPIQTLWRGLFGLATTSAWSNCYTF